MAVSNRLGITELEETQNNRSVTINEAIAKLEAGATFFAAIQVLLNTPPASPVEGDLYVVGTAGTGAWSGHNENVALYYNAAWLFFVPFEGMFAWDQTSNTLKRHDGSDWVTYTVGGGSVSDGDYGDISVSGGVWTIDAGVVTYAKMQDISATSRVLGRKTAGAGDTEELTFSEVLDFVGSAVQGDILYRNATAWVRLAAGTSGHFLKTLGAGANPTWSATAASGTPFEMVVACSDESTALSTGTAKVTFRMPCAVTLTAVRASLTTAQASGSIFTVDINEAGTTIISTKLTIDNTELTSTTAATPAVISDSSLADDALMTVDVDQIGNGTATGLKVTLIGTRT